MPLTGLLAGLLTGRLRTVLLMPAVARIGLIQQFTVAALAPSSSQHWSLQDEAAHYPPRHVEASEENPAEEDKETAEEDFLN